MRTFGSSETTMLLSDTDLYHAMTAQDISIRPLKEGQVQPASVDLRLNRYFRHFRSRFAPQPVDPLVGDTYSAISELVEADDFVIGPSEFILCSTMELVTLGPRHGARLEGKSSIGRLGISIHVTAGFIDPGFCGHPTLEVVNFLNRPIKLTAGMLICQLAVFRLGSPSTHPYDLIGSYTNQGAAPEPSRYWMKHGTRTHKESTA